MKNLKVFRFILSLLIVFGTSYLFSTVYFIVTNSDAESYIPIGESQIGFENNEFLTIDFDLTGDELWFLSDTDFSKANFYQANLEGSHFYYSNFNYKYQLYRKYIIFQNTFNNII